MPAINSKGLGALALPAWWDPSPLPAMHWPVWPAHALCYPLHLGPQPKTWAPRAESPMAWVPPNMQVPAPPLEVSHPPTLPRALALPLWLSPPLPQPLICTQRALSLPLGKM